MAFIKHGDASVVSLIEDNDNYCSKCGRKMRKRGDKYVCECELKKESSLDELRTSN